uniref:Ras-associating domain-containing protein n=1 Tax=Steinernema glaseri TaxID=37863 RepID=A0A1I7Z342_9BILA
MINDDCANDLGVGDFKIRVDGIERYVSGVTTQTTCSEIIYALAHSMKKRGKFVLVVRDSTGKEKTLAPNEQPWTVEARNQQVEFELRDIDEVTAISVMPHENSIKNQADYEGRCGPPPAYHDFIKKRHATLHSPHTNGLEGAVNSAFAKDSSEMFIMSLNLSRTELEVLLQSQSDAIREQKQYMASLDNNLRNSEQLELFQLTKQHANLRAVLNSLKSTDWPHEYRKELQRSHNITNQIDQLRNEIQRLREAIEDTNYQYQQFAHDLNEEDLVESAQ